jgi:LuxR family maltose regulon positive regulatory protein
LNILDFTKIHIVTFNKACYNQPCRRLLSWLSEIKMDPLLATKLFVPQPRPGFVARPRLVERLNQALSSGLVLVSAPAGFGKTTAVVQWALQSKKDTSIAWVQLDEGDNDPVRFWDYFIAALKTFKPAAGDVASSVLHSPQSYSIEAVLTSLINDVTDISRDFAVVLDDYHLIKSDAIHTALAFWLDHMPPRMHLVIATRADPPLPLAHFRGRGTLVEVGADDLRFTDEEAARLLKEMLGVSLTAEQVAALNAHTEGWVVGLKMAALSVRGQRDIQSFISGFTGSQRYVMDYLVEEVLKRQTGEVRDFLLKTSVVERMTASLCDFLTGGSRSRDMLVELDRANMFLVPLDESRQWYRYHHLFGDLLRHQLAANRGADEVTRLHQQASQWYEDNRLPDDAIHHALATRDWERGMNLIAAESESRLKRGEWNTLLGWFQAIPDEMLRTRPRLYSQYSNVLVTAGQFQAAEDALKHLERTAQEDAGLLGEVALFRAILSKERGDIPHHVEQLKKALLLLPSEEAAYRARASYLLSLMRYNAGRLEEAQSLLTDAYRLAREVADYWVWARVASHLGMTLWLRGKLQSALGMAQQAADMAGCSPLAAPPR